MSEPDKLICGMTPSTARRYLIVRQELDLIFKQLNKATDWLDSFEKFNGDLSKALTLTGRTIRHCAIVIKSYLDDEFVSPEKIIDAIDDQQSQKALTSFYL